MKNNINIINHSGFWGDSDFALESIFSSGESFDYLVSDYLSEVTLGLLEKLKKIRPGYIEDFITHVNPFLKTISDKKIKVITNAGANDPQGLATKLREIIQQNNLSLTVMTITGDKINDTTHAYLGAFPIAEALKKGADIIITGRVVDSAVCLAPMIYEFSWNEDNFDLLAQGSLGGHLIECGTQVCGGNFSQYHELDLTFTSYPLLNVTMDGKLTLKKLPNMTGLVNRYTVAEQLVYEIGDPGNYLLPDVICDFSHVVIEQKKDSVEITGAKGFAPPTTFKTLMNKSEFYKLSAPFVLVGADVNEKAKRVCDNILKRCERFYGSTVEQYHLELLGSESTYGYGAKSNLTREVVAVFSAKSKDKKLLEIIAKEIAPSALSMVPGMISLLGGRAKVVPLMSLESGTVSRDQVSIMISDEKNTFNFDEKLAQFSNEFKSSKPLVFEKEIHQDFRCIKLYKLAVARSGDKGNHANIGLVAKNADSYELLKKRLTNKVVAHYFNHQGKIEIFDLPGIQGLNIMLYDFLEGGGLSSLRVDSQGKGLGQQILDLEIPLREDDEI